MKVCLGCGNLSGLVNDHNFESYRCSFCLGRNENVKNSK